MLGALDGMILYGAAGPDPSGPSSITSFVGAGSSPGHQHPKKVLIRKVFRQSYGLIAPEWYTRVAHMVLSMSRPWKHPKTGTYYLRKRVPADLVPLVGRTIVKRSLGSKAPAEARQLHAEALARLEKEWEALRAGPTDLTHKEIRALVGRWYGWFVAFHEDDPGDIPEGWGMIAEEYYDLLEDAGEGGDLDGQLPPGVRARVHAHLTRWGRVDDFLAEEGVYLAPTSRAGFLDSMQRDFVAALHRLSQFAAGIYTPDERPAVYPEWTPRKKAKETSQRPAAGQGSVTITGLLEGWWKEAQASGRKPKTLQSYQSAIKRLVAFLGHDDASRVTPEDVVAYKDHRIGQTDPRTQKPISAKTIKDGDLAGLKSVFGWAVANRLLTVNPVAGITMKVGKLRRNRDPGFSDAEAAKILTASLKAARGKQTAKTYAAKRWVPWLCAYTGARVGEMAQLRKQDVVFAGGFWVIRITPEAGTVKNDQYREVPLHPHLIELGFPEFVQASAPGYLFLQPSTEGHVDGPRKGVTNRLAEFVRLEVGITDKGVLPNHAWRHRLKTISRDLGADPVVIDAIQGHSSGSVSSRYGEVSLKAKAGFIERIPRFEIDG